MRARTRSLCIALCLTRALTAQTVPQSESILRHAIELHQAGGSNPLVAGGRYDGLLARLGAREAIAAVGFAAALEELTKAGGAS